MATDECCGHAGDDHVMVATTGDPMYGGIRLCPAADCQCYATWSVAGTSRESVFVPTKSEIRRLRSQIQADA